MSLEELKQEVARLSEQLQSELIFYTLKLRHAHDPDYRKEVTDRLNNSDKAHWLTPDEFEKRLVEDQVVAVFRNDEPADLRVTRSGLANASPDFRVLR